MPLLKAVEVLVLAGAGVAFCWWQLRELDRERERTRRARQEAEAAAERAAPPSEPSRGDSAR